MGRSYSPFYGHKESWAHDNLYLQTSHSVCCISIKNYSKCDLVRLKLFCTRKKEAGHQTTFVASKEEGFSSVGYIH